MCLRSHGQQRKQQGQKVVAVHAGGQRQRPAPCGVLGTRVFPGSSDGEESACRAADLGSVPGSGRFPWRRAWQSTPVFLPGESCAQRSLVGSSGSPRGCKELDMTARLSRREAHWEQNLGCEAGD